MTPIRPMLDDLELELVQAIEVDGDQVLVSHGIPTLEGDFLQRLGRRGARIKLSGVITGVLVPADAENNEEILVAEKLKNLRDKFRAAQPMPFAADIATATRLDQVLIEEMAVRELAGKPARFEYAFTLREFTPAQEAPEEPPPEEPDPVDPELGTLIVEVIVEGRPDFDFSLVTVTVNGRQDDGTNLARPLSNRNNNIWEEVDFPPGNYTVTAFTGEPEAMTGSVQSIVSGGQTTQVQIVLRSGFIIANAFLVHFRFDNSLIEPALRPVMRQVAQHAREHPEEKLLIVGHTDKTGSDAYNQSLSERRARSAFAYLRFNNDPVASAAEWDELRRTRPAGQLPSIHDIWGTYQYQYLLQDLGFYRGNIDGDHGELTDQAIQLFRCAHHLPPGTQMDDATWQALIQAYLSQDDLNIPDSQLLPNAKDGCDGGLLKWLGCGENAPDPKWGSPPRDTAWRPFRRVEFLFVRPNTLPCDVPQPVTFDLPAPGAVNPRWCLGPSAPPPPRNCFMTYDAASIPPQKLLVKPVEKDGIVAQVRLRFENFAPGQRINSSCVIITGQGEFTNGEVPSGPDRGKPRAIAISGTADGQGVFEHVIDLGSRVEGVFSLEIRDEARAGGLKYVARLNGEPDTAATRSIVFRRLDASDSIFAVIVTPRPPLLVNASIEVERSVLVVRKPHTDPKRVRVMLRVDLPTCGGDGVFNRSTDAVRFFDALTGGTEIVFDAAGDVTFSGDQLLAGVELFAEAARPSATVNDVALSLLVATNGIAGQPGAAAFANLTAVEVTLDIAGERPAPGVEPPLLSQTDKINPGRVVSLRQPNNSHVRALMIVQQTQPPDFAGELALNRIGQGVDAFADPQEIPAAGQTAVANPHFLPPGGGRFWVEGSRISTAPRDTGYQLGIRDGEADGDRVSISVFHVNDLMLTTNVAPFETRTSLVQIEGILNGSRGSFDLADLFAPQNNSLFRIRANVAGLPGNSFQATLTSVARDGITVIERRTFTLTRASASHFLSLPILAVPSAILRAEVTFTAPQNIDIIRAEAGGRLRLTAAGSGAAAPPLEVRVRGRVLEICTVTIQGVNTPAIPIAQSAGNANRILAQSGVEVRVLNSSTVVDNSLRNIRTNNCPLTIGGDTNRNAQVLRLFQLGRATCTSNFIVYFVNTLTNLSSVPPAALRGCSAYPVGQPGVIVANSLTRYTVAHEIGHVLHLPHTPLDPDPLVVADATNLMLTTTGALLPLQPNAITLQSSQCLQIFGSPDIVFRQ